MLNTELVDSHLATLEKDSCVHCGHVDRLSCYLLPDQTEDVRWKTYRTCSSAV